MMPILLVGDPDDLTTTYLGWLARRRDIEVIELREDTLGVEWSFSFTDQHPRRGRIDVAGRSHAITDFAGAYVRLNPQPALPSGLVLDQVQQQWFVSERRAGLHNLLNCLPCPVANRPSSGRSNGSKPYQMRVLTKASFDVPAWIASNEADDVEHFAQRFPHGGVYKACSGLRSRVRRLDDEVMARLRAGTSPIVVQEYIAGRDVRVHTIQEHCFPTEILSDGVDYRFEHEGSQYRATSIPDHVAELCCRAARREGLLIAGFDFRVTADGRWYCLECNPVPTFLPYEMATGQPIGDTLLDFLGAQVP